MPPKPQSAIVRVVPNSLPEEAIVIGKTSQAIACSNGMQHPHPPFCPVRRPRCNGQSDSIAEPAIPKGPVRGCRIGTAHRAHHRRTKKGRGCGQSMAPNGVLETRTHRNRSCNARGGQVCEARVATVESSKVRLPEGAHAPHLWLTLWGRAGNPHRVVLKALFTAVVMRREPRRNDSHVFALAATLSFSFSPTATLCFRKCSSPEKPEAEEQGLPGVELPLNASRCCQFMVQSTIHQRSIQCQAFVQLFFPCSRIGSQPGH